MKRFYFALLAIAMSVVAFADNAAFPGGKEALANYLSSNLKYPPTAKQNGIEGVVNVSFVVKADGSIGTIKIVRLIDPDLEQEAIRLVKNMPAWTPATNNGNAVDSTETLDITFQLPQD